MASQKSQPKLENHPPIPAYAAPPYRELKVFAVDPSLALKVEALEVATTTLSVRWEDYQAPGPIGEYLEVIDIDPASRCYYPPVNLTRPEVLANSGLDPSEGDPRFHQQMVYAVAMKTIQSFESALGRRIHWASRRVNPMKLVEPLESVLDKKKSLEARKAEDEYYEYIPHLRIYPHALRGRNAYYDPLRKSLLFGYFPADADAQGSAISGGLVFTALSFDIVAHETTHAILDGLQRRFIEPTNPDVLAFHEAFADIVALFQHFTMPDLLEYQIAKARGDLETENVLAQLATQFGEGLGKHGALRDAIGKIETVDGKKQWQRKHPDPTELASTPEAHARGGILVSAVFDAFLEIYKHRTADLLRLASDGSGVLRPGAIAPDLVKRLAEEAAKVSKHVLSICIRALDYCPPIDITFGEYLRAILTADIELVPNDRFGYRVAFVHAFRKWGIFPKEARTLGVQTLLWSRLGGQIDWSRFAAKHQTWLERFSKVVKRNMNRYSVTMSREEVWEWSKDVRWDLLELFDEFVESHGDEALEIFGIERERPGSVNEYKLEVHSARPSFRIPVDANTPPGIDLVIQLTQKALVQPDDLDDVTTAARTESAFLFRGGSTVIYDVERSEFKYVIRKRIKSKTRRARQRDFREGSLNLEDLYFERFGDQFRMLHSELGEL